MMSHHIWKTVDAGVMLWEPAPEAATTQGLEEQLHASEERGAEALASSDDAEQEVILPSIEEVFEPPCITTMSEQDYSMLLFSSPSISFSEKDSTPETSPVLRLDNTLITCSEPFANSNLYEQLEEFAHSPTKDSIALSQSQSSTSSKKTNSIGSQSTPCPSRPPHPESKAMGRFPKFRKFKHRLGANTSRPVERKLKFDTKRSQVKTSSGAASPPPPLPVRELSNLQSLAALRRIERDPCHSWDEDERELLTVLYRWYNNADPSTIPKVFNAITGLNLKLSVVRYQFENHILLYGGRAFPEYARVMSVPFDDPQGRYYDIRDIIEETTAESGINLPRRDTEMLFNDGTARYAKSPRTRRTYRALVRKAAQKEKEKVRIARRVSQHVEPIHQHVEELAYQKQSGMSYHLGRMTMAVHSDQVDEEDWCEVEDFKTPLSIPEELQFMPSSTTRNIAFRVWDANSRTAFSEDAGFVSQAFTIWRNEYPPPFSFNGQGGQALMILTNLHLSLQGGASTFVSLSTSLLQALVKASTMDNPRIAVVALDHPLLTAPDKTLPAADVLRMLKSEGLAWWARYKGHAERMVWCNVPAEAILSHFPLADLQSLSDADDACSELLSLSEIRPGKRTRHVSARIQAKNNSIDNIVSARALACIARAFGMHRENVSLEHIQGLVAALVDSLQLMHNNNESAPHSPILSSRITQAFAAKLESECHCVEAVASAFLSGVRQGADTIAYYSRRRGRPRSRE